MKKKKLTLKLVNEAIYAVRIKNKREMIFSFFVPGHPVGRQEPQQGKHGWYTPLKTVKYYAHIRNSFQRVYPRLNDKTHKWRLRLDIYVKGKQYPDNSNVIKAVEDSLQGYIWANDKQVWHTEGIRHEACLRSDFNEGVYVYAEMMGEKGEKNE